MSRRRGCRGSGATKRSRPVRSNAIASNVIEQGQYSDWIMELCMMRFKWNNLPPTCSERFLEMTLANLGCACIAWDADTPDFVMTLQAGAYSEYNAYMDPIKWQAMGMNGRVYFDVQRGVNGVFCWDRQSRICYWPKLVKCAEKLALYSRTENVNLLHQFAPFLITAPEEKVIDVQNAFAAVVAGEPAVIGYDGLADTVANGIKAIQTGVEWKGEELQRGALGTWSEIFRLIGIPHLMFEKSERMTPNETQTSYAPSRLMLDGGLKARQAVCDEFNEITDGRYNISVEVNPYLEQMFTTQNNQQEVIGDAMAGETE